MDRQIKIMMGYQIVLVLIRVTYKRVSGARLITRIIQIVKY
ncbi:hypothetical protein [Fructobacillus americanaquae]